MEVDEAALLARARRAYESGRLRAALWVTVYIAPLVLVSLIGCGTLAGTLASGSLLTVVAVGMRWRGDVYGRSVLPGIVAGLAAFWTPLLAAVIESHGGPVVPLAGLAALGGGIVTGSVVGVGVARLETDQTRFMISAASVAALTGSLGCLLAGAAGLIGMLAGIVATTTPVLLAVRARA